MGNLILKSLKRSGLKYREAGWIYFKKRNGNVRPYADFVREGKLRSLSLHRKRHSLGNQYIL